MHNNARAAGPAAVFKRNAMALAVATCFSAGAAWANPTNPAVVNGVVSFAQNGNLLTVTNSPNAIINWGSFSIGASEITRFIQQNNASAVLNRVVGQDPSAILGALQSNGRVFVINPNGIVFGAGSQIDVAGLVASTLNLSNADFLAGRLRFTDGLGNSVINNGNITTPSGGSVYLIGNAVTNNGIITSRKGEVVLAAGNSVELVNPGTPNLRVEVIAPDNEARNLGQITAEAGRIGIYAGLINHGGTINANSVEVDQHGQILLKATRNATLETGSTTTANGPTGGSITVQSGDTTLVSGNVSATGTAGKGGNISVLGNLVGLINNASLNASGDTGGGSVLIGGDLQGKNPDVQNAFRTYVSPGSTILADALRNGDGGKVIVWADDATRYYGSISAKGGANSGNGGFVEVSGKGYLDFNGIVNTTAPNGNVGTLLLDPRNITINHTGPTAGGTALPNFDANADNAVILDANLNTSLASNNVVITTGTTGTQAGNITVASDAVLSWSVAQELKLLAHNNITVDGTINTTGGNVKMYAGWDGTSPSASPLVTAGTGNISLNNNVIVNTSTANMVFKAGNNITVAPGVFVQNLTGFGNTITVDAGGSVSAGLGSRIEVTALATPVQSNLHGEVDITAGGDITLSGATVRAQGGYSATGGGAVVLIAGGNLQIDNGALVSASAIAPPSGGAGYLANGGAGYVSFSANGNVTIDSSSVSVTGGNGIASGDATFSMILPGGATGNVSITGSSGISATGGGNSTANTGGQALITINTPGTLTLDGSSDADGMSINASGGTGIGGGNQAQVTLTSGGNFTMNSARALATAGGPAVGGSGIGQNAGVTVNVDGTVSIINNSSIQATGSNALGTAGGGNGIIGITTTGAGGNIGVADSSVVARGGNAATAGADQFGGQGRIDVTSSGSLTLSTSGSEVLRTVGGNPAGTGFAVGGSSIINATAASGISVTGGGTTPLAISAEGVGTSAETITLTATNGAISVSNALISGGALADPVNTSSVSLIANGTGGGIQITGGGKVGSYGSDQSDITLTTTSGVVNINNGQLEATGGSALNAGQGRALIQVTGGNGITVQSSNISATGSTANIGGLGKVALTSSGGAVLVDNSTIAANGGATNSFATAGAAVVDINGTGITVQNGSSVQATGGDDSTNGGAATDTLTASSGAVNVDASSTITATSGDGFSGNAGNASVTLTGPSGVTTGTINATRGTGGITATAGVTVTSSSGSVDINNNITVSPSGGTGTLTINAANAITSSGSSVLKVATPADPASSINLTAVNGIGASGAPVRIFDDSPDITVTNTGTGNIFGAVTTGDINIVTFGATTASGNIDITAAAGNISVGAGSVVSNPNGTLTLRAQGSSPLAGLISVAATGSVSGKDAAGGNGVSLIADNMNILGSVTANAATPGTGAIYLQPFSNGRVIDLGGAGVALNLTGAMLSQMTAGNIIFGLATTPTQISTAAVTTTGAQTYNGPVTLLSNATLSGTNISFNNTLNGAQALTVNASGITTFGGAVGGTTPLASLTTDAAGSTALNGGAITTTGNQTYNDAASLGAATTLSGTNISFNNTLNGAQALTVNASGVTTFGGAVGGTTPLASLTTDAAGSTALNGGAITTTGPIALSDQVTGSNVTVNAGAAAVNMNNPANDFTGVVTLSGSNTNISDSNSVTLGTLNIGGTNTVGAGANIVLNGPVTASGAGVILNLNPGNQVQTPAATTLTIDGGAGGLTAVVKNGKVWQNDGTITLQGSSAIRLPNEAGYATFSNSASGLLNINAPAGGWSFLSDSLNQGGIVNNAGTINVNNSTSWEAAYTNAPGGVLNIAAGQYVSMQNGQSLQGTVSMGSGSTLWVSERHGTNTTFNGTTITGNGTLQVVAGVGPIADFTSVNAAGTTLLVGSGGTANFIGATSTFANMNMTGGSVGGGGNLTLGTGPLNYTGGAINMGGTLKLAGTNVLNGPALSVGTLDLSGADLTLQSGSFTTGTLAIGGGKTFTQTGGSVNATTANVTGTLIAGASGYNVGTTNILAGGLLKGTGTVNGSVNNDGTVSPGASPGILTIAGNYSQGPTGILIIEIGGLTPGSLYDQLLVGGNATLNGTLNTTLISGFTPASGNLFNIIKTSTGTVSGTFATLNVPLNSFLAATYLANGVDISLSPLSLLGGGVVGGLVGSLLVPSTELAVTGVLENKDIFPSADENKDIFGAVDGKQPPPVCN